MLAITRPSQHWAALIKKVVDYATHHYDPPHHRRASARPAGGDTPTITDAAGGEQQAAEAAAAAEQQDLEQVIWASGKLTAGRVGGCLARPAAARSPRSTCEEGDRGERRRPAAGTGERRAAKPGGSRRGRGREAQAALAKLTAGATAADIAAAEAAVEAAKAQVAVAGSPMLEVQSAVDAANAQVSMAQAQYAEVASHPTEQERLRRVPSSPRPKPRCATPRPPTTWSRAMPAIGAHAAVAGAEAGDGQHWRRPTRSRRRSCTGPTAGATGRGRARPSMRRDVGVAAAENRSAGAEANVRAAHGAGRPAPRLRWTSCWRAQPPRISPWPRRACSRRRRR